MNYRKTILQAFVAGLALAVSSCNSDGPSGGKSDIPPISEFKAGPKAAKIKSNVPDFAETAFHSAINIVEQEYKEEDNMAFSPLSLEIALAMLANGTDEATNQRISRVIGYDNVNDLNEFVNLQMRYLTNTKVSGIDLRLANSAWLSDKLQPSEEVMNVLNEYFYAQNFTVDFTKDATAGLVNGWVKEKTNGLIPSLMDKIPSSTHAILANALYMAGNWQIPFSETATKREIFYGTSDERVVDMMHAIEGFQYCNDDNGRWQSVSLAFEGDSDTHMTFILPEEGIDIMDFAKTFSRADIKSIMEDSFEWDILLSLPKFEFSSCLELPQLFREMGIDNGNVTFEKFGLHEIIELYGLQKTCTKIDEEGAKVAIVTSTGDMETAVAPTVPTVSLNFNRPFLFMVHNETSGAVILLGMIRNL